MQEFKNRETGAVIACEFVPVEPDKPETIEGFLCCLHEEYGNSYTRESVYNPGLFAEELRRGELLCLLAKTDRGEPAASLALLPCEEVEGAHELSMHVIRKEFRGFGIGTPLTKAILCQPGVENYASVAVHSATFHVKAQHQTLSCGLVPTGFLFSCHINALLQHSFPMNGVKKQSFAVAVHPEKKKSAGELFIPGEHRKIVEETYRRLGVDVLSLPGEAPRRDTVWSVHNDTLHHTVTAMVTSCGSDLEEKISDILGGGSDPDKTVNLLINMNSPGAPAAYEQMKKMGFFFAGTHPLCEGGEFLIMHHPLDNPVPFEKLCIDNGYSEIFDYIRNRV